MASSVFKLQHICHICRLCSTDKIRQFWHVVQNCSIENVCTVCEKYDVYAEGGFLGTFLSGQPPGPPPPFWEFCIGKTIPNYPVSFHLHGPPKHWPMNLIFTELSEVNKSRESMWLAHILLLGELKAQFKNRDFRCEGFKSFFCPINQ